MTADIAQALLLKVLPERLIETRAYFQNIAKYKYDDYQQYAPGMRFIERFALWLNQFDIQDREHAIEFVKSRLIFISEGEMNLLVSSCFPDIIRKLIIQIIATKENIPTYKLSKLTSTKQYKLLLRQSLFCGLSDGARTEIFRRANTGVISHEQVYQTYELSDMRAAKMQKELKKDIGKTLEREPTSDEAKFKCLFLLDDFSASGTSYLRYDEKAKVLGGKIYALYENIFGNKNPSLQNIFDLQSLQIHVVLYLSTEQAKEQIQAHFPKLNELFHNQPSLHYVHLIPSSVKLKPPQDSSIIALCQNPAYYDKEIEDEHTGKDIQMGFQQCALPLILFHNSPNNSIPILWAYDNLQFTGLFPRIPRHKQQ